MMRRALMWWLLAVLGCCGGGRPAWAQGAGVEPEGVQAAATPVALEGERLVQWLQAVALELRARVVAGEKRLAAEKADRAAAAAELEAAVAARRLGLWLREVAGEVGEGCLPGLDGQWRCEATDPPSGGR